MAGPALFPFPFAPPLTVVLASTHINLPFCCCLPFYQPRVFSTGKEGRDLCRPGLAPHSHIWCPLQALFSHTAQHRVLRS